jgi:ferredoxin
MDPRCDKCEECVRACPVGAFTGRSFDQHEPREARFDARKCDQYFKDMEKEMPKPVCGMCVYICPHGRKMIKKQSTFPHQSRRCWNRIFSPWI